MDSITAAKLELSVTYTAEVDMGDSVSYSTAPPGPEEAPPDSLEPPVTFVSRGGCTLTMTFEYENQAPT